MHLSPVPEQRQIIVAGTVLIVIDEICMLLTMTNSARLLHRQCTRSVRTQDPKEGIPNVQFGTNHCILGAFVGSRTHILGIRCIWKKANAVRHGKQHPNVINYN